MPENCTHDCSTCGESCSERDLRVPANALSSIKKVIAVVSGKGGVGKSTVTSLLAIAMRRKGIMPQKRPAAGGEARNRASFLFTAWKSRP